MVPVATWLRPCRFRPLLTRRARHPLRAVPADGGMRRRAELNLRTRLLGSAVRSVRQRMVRHICHDSARFGTAELRRYRFGGTCWKCAPGSVVIVLFVLLVVGGFGLIALYLWKTMADPRIGSPLNLMLGMLETLGILRLTSVRWPDSVARMLTMVSLVNFNVEVFQTQCLLGPPHPITGALSYVGSLFGATVIAAFFWPLLKLGNRLFPVHIESVLEEHTLEGACYAVRPDRANPDLHVPLEYSPTQFLRRASLSEYTQISGAVRPLPCSRIAEKAAARLATLQTCSLCAAAGDLEAGYFELPCLVRTHIGQLSLLRAFSCVHGAGARCFWASWRAASLPRMAASSCECTRMKTATMWTIDSES
jgi:hypothetical protein